jgi:hypothetical protein
MPSKTKTASADISKTLGDALSVLGQFSDYKTTLRAVPSWADYALFRVVNSQGAMERVEIACKDPEKESVLREIAIRHSWANELETVGKRSLQSGKPYLVEKIDEAYFRKISHTDDAFARLKKLGTATAVAAPMIAGGKIIGSISAGRFSRRPQFTQEDLDLLSKITSRAAVSIHQAVLYHQMAYGVRKIREIVTERRSAFEKSLKGMEKELGTLRGMIRMIEDRSVAQKLKDSTGSLIRHVETIQGEVEELSILGEMFNDRYVEEIRPVQLSTLLESSLSRLQGVLDHKSIHLKKSVEKSPEDVLCKSGEVAHCLDQWLSGILVSLPKNAELDVRCGSKGGEVMVTASAEKVEFLESGFDPLREVIERWGGHPLQASNRPTLATLATLGFALPVFRPN